MREIKFRGKSLMAIEELDHLGIKHKNGFVFGNLIADGGNTFIVGGIADVDEDYIAHDWWVSVDPETVGQYTCLKDKNGVQIYEGDVVRYLDQYITSTESGTDFDDFMNIGEIFFDEEFARYDISNKNGLDYDDIFDGSNDFEVIGNIYENKELLEESS